MERALSVLPPEDLVAKVYLQAHPLPLEWPSIPRFVIIADLGLQSGETVLQLTFSGFLLRDHALGPDEPVSQVQDPLVQLD